MNLTSLKAYMEERKADFIPSRTNPTWEDSENKIWAVQEYLSSKGEFSDEDKAFLREYDPELLTLEEEQDEDFDYDTESGNPEPNDEEALRVIFKVDGLEHITAVFPDVPWSTNGKDFCTCVTAEEGHGECCREWVEEQENLPPERLDEAMSMLKRMGYYSVKVVENW